MRTYEQMKDEALQTMRALHCIGWAIDKIRQVVRFHVTDEELEVLIEARESRMIVAVDTGHIAHGGTKVGFFGVPVVTDKGEIVNHLF